MTRFAVLSAALILSSGVAAAMPADLPWEPYMCKDGKGLSLKFLSDGLAIGIQVGGDEKTEFTTVPVDEEKQAGFKPGIYKGDGDLTLTLAEDGTVGVIGSQVEGAPYEGCKAHEGH